MVCRVQPAAHGRAREQARGVGALGLIQVLVQLLLSSLKMVCSRSTPHIITIAQSEKKPIQNEVFSESSIGLPPTDEAV